MEILIVAACGLVANQYMELKSTPGSVSRSEPNEQETSHDFEQDTVGAVAPQNNKSSVPTSVSTSVPRNIPISSPAPIPLGVRTLKTDNIGDVGYDDARYNEQYLHPQDPNPNVSEKPWMRMANAPYKPKEEIVSDVPGPQDMFGRNMNSRVKKIEADFAASTVPVTSEKQFDRPVEQISTGNGSAIGFHIGAGRRYHKFILNDQETIESDGGPRGAFSGASGQHVKGDYRTVTQRSSLNHESVGPPMAVGVPHLSAPAPSFEIKPAHMEEYTLDDHMSKGMRAPVQASASTENVKFKGAHDENLEVLHTSLVTGGERFATGASGYRETKLHVPLNNDPVATYDQRVVPNFKIAKASDYQEQQITARQMMIPEMPQNVSALRKDGKPPVLGSTTHKNSSLVLETEGIKCGSGLRGLSSLPTKVQSDSFRAAADSKVVMADKAALVSVGASASHAVGSSFSSSPSSLFRTTQSMSETVGTPFIRGAGSKRASNLEAIHESTDTHLSEMESSGILHGLNKVSTATSSTATRPSSSKPQTQKQERGDVFKKSERDPVLVSPGILGSNRTGAANLDVGGMLSQRGLNDDDVNVMRVGTTNNVIKVSSNRNKQAGSSSTKNRKLGDVINARMGSSPALKKLLKNPYSLPAASRPSAL